MQYFELKKCSLSLHRMFFHNFAAELQKSTIIHFMNNNIKNLVFDFGRVLIDVDRERSIKAFHDIEFTQADNLISYCYKKGIFRELELGNISSEVFYQSIHNEAKRGITDEQIKNAWNSMLVGIKPHKLEKLIELRKQYKIYLLSNTNIIHWDAAKEMFSWGEYKREDYFDDIFLSFEMHLCKPDPNIFRALTNRVSILPYNTLLLDDSEENCQAARSIGWQAHCVRQDEEWLTLF